MLDLSNSVILPRDDYIELSTLAWDQSPTTTAERIASTVQTTIICTVLAGAFVGAAWGWAKAMMQLEDKKLANEILLTEEKQKLYKVT